MKFRKLSIKRFIEFFKPKQFIEIRREHDGFVDVDRFVNRNLWQYFVFNLTKFDHLHFSKLDYGTLDHYRRCYRHYGRTDELWVLVGLHLVIMGIRWIQNRYSAIAGSIISRYEDYFDLKKNEITPVFWIRRFRLLKFFREKVSRGD